MSKHTTPEALNNRLGAIAVIGVIALVVIVATAIFWPGNNPTMRPTPPKPTTAKVSLNGQTFNLELAINQEQRARGLMFRTHLPDDGGMLFVFLKEEEQSFWMKDCRIDLDIIFLDQQGTIVSIHPLAAPPEGAFTQPSCISAAPALFVVELAGGKAKQLGLKAGQLVQMNTNALKGLAQ